MSPRFVQCKVILLSLVIKKYVYREIFWDYVNILFFTKLQFLNYITKDSWFPILFYYNSLIILFILVLSLSPIEWWKLIQVVSVFWHALIICWVPLIFVTICSLKAKILEVDVFIVTGVSCSQALSVYRAGEYMCLHLYLLVDLSIVIEIYECYIIHT